MARTISHYRLEGELGRGGMGVVHRATDLRLAEAFTVRALMSRIRELLPSRPDGPGASAAPGGDR